MSRTVTKPYPDPNPERMTPLLKRIENFLGWSGMDPREFGELVAGDPALVGDMRQGRQPRHHVDVNIRMFLSHRFPRDEEVRYDVPIPSERYMQEQAPYDAAYIKSEAQSRGVHFNVVARELIRKGVRLHKQERGYVD